MIEATPCREMIMRRLLNLKRSISFQTIKKTIFKFRINKQVKIAKQRKISLKRDYESNYNYK